MNTDDFINMLASGAAPIDRWALAKRFSMAVVIGLISAILLTAVVLGIRHDLAQVAATPIFWAKIALPLCLMVGALSMVTRLAKPGVAAGSGKWLVAAGVLAVWAGATYVLATALPDARAAIILGKSWRVCPLNITVLSVPGFIAIFWALRGLAPTDLRRAGACGGLLSSALATLAYCLHCPEMEVPFWGAWYLLGMFIPAVIGGIVGPRLLHW